ncbi:MAG TPA: hypothetical protein VLQ80_12760 [Candidatus Saccharimonadia bacterium]|nr:hypothetical protein [Candidatus Saccharimonadia bacterium]
MAAQTGELAQGYLALHGGLGGPARLVPVGLGWLGALPSRTAERRLARPWVLGLALPQQAKTLPRLVDAQAGAVPVAVASSPCQPGHALTRGPARASHVPRLAVSPPTGGPEPPGLSAPWTGTQRRQGDPPA